MSQWFYRFRSSIRYLQDSRATVELIYSLAAIALLIGLSFATEVEFVEMLYTFTRAHEDWELDEFIFSFLWVAIIVSIYAVRRVVDITNLSKTNQYNANHDSLTGLPNRDYSLRTLSETLYKTDRYNSSVAVFFLDLNDFKAINDTFGHDHGDLLMEHMGHRLSAAIQGQEVASRLGGDEFLVFTEILNDNDDLAPIISRIQTCTKRPFDIYGKSIKVNFSIGVAVSPEHGESVNELLAAADAAMYEAKQNKNVSVFHYNHDVGERNKKYLRLSSNLKSALANKEFYLAFQPIVDTYSGKIEGYEALTRWELNGEQINPELLVSIAENIGLSDQFFQWLMDTVVTDSRHFQTREQFISVNVTAKQFLSHNFFNIVKETLDKLNGRVINLEITESSILADYEEAVSRIHQLRTLGIKVMIDDFGTGYSSLGRLRELEIDKIKIDKSFLAYADVNQKSAKIFESIFALAATLEIDVVAEGLETMAQLEVLRSFPPMLTQGYLLQKPVKKELLAEEADFYPIINGH